MTTSDTRGARPTTDPLAMPENHLDMVVTPSSVDVERTASLRTRLVAVIAMPFFFILAFTLCYVSATHAPVPHDMALTIAAPTAIGEQLADAINDEAEGAFTITLTESASSARAAVEDREAVGAILVEGDAVTSVIASGGGRLATSVVENVGAQVAGQLGGSSTVEDVAPLPGDDPGGSVLFFFLVICTVGAFLSITVVSQAIAQVRLRQMLATAAGAALVVPVLGFAMISVYVDFEVPFGTVAAVIGIGMVYSFTIGLLATFFTLLLGQGAVFAEILFLVALNFPSSGGSAPESMLPPFWQVVHNGWVGSGGFEAMRSVLFFDGAQADRWLSQLFIWTASALVAIVLVAVLQRRRSARALASPVTEPSRSTTGRAAHIAEPQSEPVEQSGDTTRLTNPA